MRGTVKYYQHMSTIPEEPSQSQVQSMDSINRKGLFRRFLYLLSGILNAVFSLFVADRSTGNDRTRYPT